MKNQTPEICLEAVRKGKDAAKYIDAKFMTHDFQMELYGVVNLGVIEHLEI